MPRTVMFKEKMDSVAYWRGHITRLREQGVPGRIITPVCWYTNPDAIGYEQGQIDPGPDGRWQMYDYLREVLSPKDLLVATGLTAEEVTQREAEDPMLNMEFDSDLFGSDDPTDVDERIRLLEEALGLEPLPS